MFRLRPRHREVARTLFKASANGFYYDENHYIYEPETIDADTMEWKHNRRFKMVGRVVDGVMVDNK